MAATNEKIEAQVSLREGLLYCHLLRLFGQFHQSKLVVVSVALVIDDYRFAVFADPVLSVLNSDLLFLLHIFCQLYYNNDHLFAGFPPLVFFGYSIGPLNQYVLPVRNLPRRRALCVVSLDVLKHL